MKKDSINYEIGVLMAMAHIGNDEKMADSVKTIIAALEDEEICNKSLLRGIKNELEDVMISNSEDSVVEKILEEYELNIDIHPMTMEDDEKLAKFFEREELFISFSPNLSSSDMSYHEKYFVDDFKLAKDTANNDVSLHVYTVVDGDNGTSWITNGWHFVDRQGYFFTTQRIDIPEEGLRYW